MKMEKILVIQTAFIGDAILTLPMIQKLSEGNPQYEIDVLAIPATQDIFSASPFVKNILVMDKKGKHKSFFSLLNFIGEIKKNNYTRIYSPHRSFRTSFIVMSLGVKETFGFSSSSLKHVYKNLINYNPLHHEVQRNLDLIGYKYNGEGWKILPKVKPSVSAKEKIDGFIEKHRIKNEFLTIAPGSVWGTKKYPAEYFEEIIKHFKGNGKTVVLIGSEKEKILCENITGKFNDMVINAAGMFSLIETAELLKRSKILISNDSAPAHLGMLADIPVLTIYCSTVPEFGFYPYNDKSFYISQNGLSCKPCGIHGYDNCPLGNFACGLNLKPDNVINKIEEMINDKN